MIIIPAIDLMGGVAVRLAEGDPDQVTRYSSQPLELVARFAAAGAQWIHVVDLDGAFDATTLTLSRAYGGPSASGVELHRGGATTGSTAPRSTP